MRVSLNLSLELNLPLKELNRSGLRGFVRQALLDSQNVAKLGKNIRVGPATPVYTAQEQREVAGRARAASMTAIERHEAARKAALARWGK